MNDFEESVSGEWERDQAEEQHVGLLSKEDTENRRRSSFWDFEDDLEGDDDDHRAQRSQDKVRSGQVCFSNCEPLTATNYRKCCRYGDT